MNHMGTCSNKPIIIVVSRGAVPETADFFVCLRMKRTEEDLLKLLDMKDRVLQCRG